MVSFKDSSEGGKTEIYILFYQKNDQLLKYNQSQGIGSFLCLGLGGLLLWNRMCGWPIVCEYISGINY